MGSSSLFVDSPRLWTTVVLSLPLLLFDNVAAMRLPAHVPGVKPPAPIELGSPWGQDWVGWNDDCEDYC